MNIFEVPQTYMAHIKVNSPPPYFVGQIFLGQCEEEAS